MTHRVRSEIRVSILTQCLMAVKGRSAIGCAAGGIVNSKRTVAEIRARRRSGYRRPADKMPPATAAKVRTASTHAAEVCASTSHPAAEVRTSASHPAAEMTAPAEMRTATAVTASAASRGRVGHPRNHDGKDDNGQEIEF
jgi:hypothetical protein